MKTAALTPIRLADEQDRTQPRVIVPYDVIWAAKEHKQRTWTELVGLTDGYSAPIPAGPLRDALAGAYALAYERPGGLVWLITEDYKRPEYVLSDEYKMWMAGWNECETREQRIAYRRDYGDVPHTSGEWVPGQGEILSFLTLDYDEALLFVG